MKAWLVTWLGSPSVRVPDEVAAILPPSWREARVSQSLELLYARATCSVGGLAAHASKPSSNPHRAFVGNHGAGVIYCGGVPKLCARLVTDLVVTRDEDSGFETVSWREPDEYRLDEDDNVVVERTGQHRKFTRRREGPVSDEPEYGYRAESPDA